MAFLYSTPTTERLTRLARRYRAGTAVLRSDSDMEGRYLLLRGRHWLGLGWSCREAEEELAAGDWSHA